MSETSNQVQNNLVSPSMVVLTPAPGEIQLFLIKAENIPQGHTKHPVYISITADGRRKFKSPLSEVNHGTALFNKMVSGIHPLQSQQLTLTFKKKRTWHKNEIITQFFLPVQEISSNGKTEIILPPQDNGSKPPFITLRAAFMPLSVSETLPEIVSEPNLESSAPVIAVIDLASASAQPGSTIAPASSSAVAAQEAVDSAELALSTMDQANSQVVSGIEPVNPLPDAFQYVYHEWGPLLHRIMENIKPFLDLIDTVSEVHPYIKITWTVFSIIPRVIVHQYALDMSIIQLQNTIVDTLCCCFEADLNIRLSKDTQQRKILSALFRLIAQCGHFILNYAANQSFVMRLLKNAFTDVNTRVEEFQLDLDHLKKNFLSFAIIDIQAKNHTILDGIKGLEEKFRKHDVHTTLNRLHYPTNAGYYSLKGFLPGTQQNMLERIHTWFWYRAHLSLLPLVPRQLWTLL